MGERATEQAAALLTGEHLLNCYAETHRVIVEFALGSICPEWRERAAYRTELLRRLSIADRAEGRDITDA